MPETPSGQHETQVGKEIAEVSRAIDVAERVEDLSPKWNKHLSAIETALKGPGEKLKEAANKVVDKLYDFLKAHVDTSPVAVKFMDGLNVMLEKTHAVNKFTETFLNMSYEEQKKFIGEKMQVREVTPQQQRDLQTLELMQTLTGAFLSSLGETNPSSPVSHSPDMAEGKLKLVQSQISETYPKVLRYPDVSLDKAVSSSISIFKNPLYLLGSRNMPPVDFSNIKTAADQAKLRGQVCWALAKIGQGLEAEKLALSMFPERARKAKEKVRSKVQHEKQRAKHNFLLQALGKFDETIEGLKDRYDLEAFSVEDAKKKIYELADIAGSQAAAQAEPGLIFEAMNTEGLNANQELVWNEINDIFAYQFDPSNPLNLAETTKEGLETAAMEIGILVASIAIPEYFGAVAVQVGTKALRIMRASRYYDALVLAARFSNSAKAAVSLSRYAQAGTKLMMYGASTEVTAQTLSVLLRQKDLEQAIHETPWLKNIVVNMMVKGMFDVTSRPLGKADQVLGYNIAQNLGQAGTIMMGRQLVKMGQKTACAYFFGEAMKKGEYTGPVEDIVRFCGTELYELCGCPKF